MKRIPSLCVLAAAMSFGFQAQAQDKLQRAIFGVSVVSSEAAVCDSVLQQVARAAETQEDAVRTDRQTEIVSFGDELYGGDHGG